MGAETEDGAVNRQLPRKAAFIAGQALIADFVICDVMPGAAFENVVLSETHDAVLGMEPGIHPLDDIANQLRSSSSSQNARSTRSLLAQRVSVKCSRPQIPPGKLGSSMRYSAVPRRVVCARAAGVCLSIFMSLKMPMGFYES